jgi:hypothetical protein
MSQTQPDFLGCSDYDLNWSNENTTQLRASRTSHKSEWVQPKVAAQPITSPQISMQEPVQDITNVFMPSCSDFPLEDRRLQEYVQREGQFAYDNAEGLEDFAYMTEYDQQRLSSSPLPLIKNAQRDYSATAQGILESDMHRRASRVRRSAEEAAKMKAAGTCVRCQTLKLRVS